MKLRIGDIIEYRTDSGQRARALVTGDGHRWYCANGAIELNGSLITGRPTAVRVVKKSTRLVREALAWLCKKPA